MRQGGGTETANVSFSIVFIQNASSCTEKVTHKAHAQWIVETKDKLVGLRLGCRLEHDIEAAKEKLHRNQSGSSEQLQLHHR
jgi:hypothetical protein